MNEFYVIGAGTLAKLILESTPNAKSSMKCIGILDDYATVGSTIQDVKVVGNLAHIRVLPRGSKFIIGIGDPKVRKGLSLELNSLGHKLASVIHESAVIMASAVIGEGTFIGPLSSVLGESRIGHSTCILASTNVNQNVTIGDYALIGASVSIGNNASIGEGAHLGLGTCIPLGGTVNAWSDA